MDINDRIDRFFKSKDLANADVARMMGVHRSYISKFRTNRSPNMEFFTKLVEIWPEVDMNYIIKGGRYEDYPIGDTGVTTQVEEPKALHTGNPARLFDEIEERLRILREEMTQK